MLVGALALAIVVGSMQWGSHAERSLNFVYRPLCAAILSGLVSWCVVYSAWRGPLGWRLGLPLLILTYVGIEHFAAPYMIRAFAMTTYLAVQDPDHRPQNRIAKQGWNSDSLRCPHEPGQFKAQDTNVLFLGDSFTFGMKLEPHQCFPQLVENQLRGRFSDKKIRVSNFGWTSSSPLLSWRRLIDIGEKYAPDLVVMCIDMTDIRDDIRWRAMLDLDGMYWLIDKLPLTMRALEITAPSAYEALFRVLNPELPDQRYFVSEAPLEETRPFFTEITKNLDRIKAWCDDHGAHFAVIVLPRTYQYSDRESPLNWEADEYTVLGPYSLEPFRYFDELREVVDYPIHSLLETFQLNEVFPTSFEDDPHWTAAGARVAASAITSILVGELATLGLP